MFKTPVDSEDNVWLSSSRGFQAGGPPPPSILLPPPRPHRKWKVWKVLCITREPSRNVSPLTHCSSSSMAGHVVFTLKRVIVYSTHLQEYSLSLCLVVLRRILTARNSGVNQATRGSNKYLFDYANSIVCFTAGNSDEEKDMLSWMMSRNLSMQNIFSVFPVEFFLF